ncbi:GNAT family N-acetyltransferase [Mucilaginibacter sp. X5P1]|uniref:GNAT family N-acetyltransferase n=1 Tax=Mucilaginibacter sp. X5P1 TaxID=2723088 RepID=UPI001617059B|nr:GNAT family N-acetyltransferase [Mucilaginibacter sp. X5P1]MBB6141414.1 L-amino acid N-acyltransferase YncA [Mucilaginibacter sp. X5P1]
MTADYLIRAVTENDLDELMLMIQEHADYELAEFTPEHKKERLRKTIFSEHAKLNCWVVEQQEKLTGYVTYTFDYSTWDAADFMYMDCLYLREATRGNGIGTAIIQKLRNVAKEKSCINIQWQTPDFNESAIRFYHKNKATSKNKVRFTLSV